MIQPIATGIEFRVFSPESNLGFQPVQIFSTTLRVSPTTKILWEPSLGIVLGKLRWFKSFVRKRL
jgi:hypothetical protein